MYLLNMLRNYTLANIDEIFHITHWNYNCFFLKIYLKLLKSFLYKTPKPCVV